MGKLKWHIVLVLALWLVFCGMAAAEQLYVNESGWWRDGGAFYRGGTPIQAAVNAADNGDSIYVWNGSYSENVVVDKRLTLEGEGADVVTMTSTGDHVFEVTADYVNISEFTATGARGVGKAGIYLIGRQNCNISGNIASNNHFGIYPSSSSNNKLTDNTVSNNHGGIYLCESSNNNTLINNTASKNKFGIGLFSSNDNMLRNNNASNNDYYDGIYLYSSSNNTLTNNIVSNNKFGICLASSSNNTLTNNNASDNDHGIGLSSSSNNMLRNNNASNNYYFEGIYLYSSSNNTLTNNIVLNNKFGICLASSSNNTLTNNIASDNNQGIYLYYYSSNNKIANNTANSNNDYGIYLHSLSNNLIYNNYFNNTHNAYDNGNNQWNITKTNGTNIINGSYLGGNYWSDYIDVDADGDGAGDSPYSIHGGINKDYLPLATIPKTIYIDDDFSDDPLNHTWDTIQEGLNDANHGDTIVTYNGTYYGAVNLIKSVTLRGEDATNTIIHGEWAVDKVINVAMQGALGHYYPTNCPLTLQNLSASLTTRHHRML